MTAQADRQNASAQLDDIMHRTLDSMLAVTPCSTADPYFASAILPHRLVFGYPILSRTCFHLTDNFNDSHMLEEVIIGALWMM